MGLAASPILSGNDNFVRFRNALAQPGQDEAGTALHEASWGKRFHPASMSRVVRRLGFSRQKARHVHPQSDALAQAAFAKKGFRAHSTTRQPHTLASGSRSGSRCYGSGHRSG